MTATLQAHPAAALARRHLDMLGAGDSTVDLTVDWAGPVDLPLTNEFLVQAACGIMHVHGRARGVPEPLAVDYATTLAAILGAQGVLAAEFARSRGGRVAAVRTSVAQAALLSVGQYLVAGPVPAGRGEPPPFTAADGVALEIETLKAEDWQRFWRSAGAAEEALREGWPPFLHRFATAVCPLPPALHAALAALPSAEIVRLGRAAGVSVVPVGDAPTVPLWTFTPLPGHARSSRSDVDLALPLRGVRVVESTRRVQGPLAGHVLAMLGADVVRIEPPGGDPARGVPPLVDGVSARFAALNAGKDVVELDLADPGDRVAARELVADADVFLHNWAPHRAAAWQLDSTDLSVVRPGLVYAAASGWGSHLGAEPPIGTDYVVQAYSGLAAAVRPAVRAPSLMTITDVLGGLVCAQGVLAALVQRERTGVGTRVDTSLLSAASAVPRQRTVFDRPLWIDGDHVALGGDRLVPVATDLVALAADPRFAGAIGRPPWEFA